MRKLGIGLALVVLAACGKLYAQDALERLNQRIGHLHLSADQEARVADIRKECRAKIQEAKKELETLGKEEMEKIHAVLTPEQKTKLAALKEKRQEAREEGLAQHITNLKELDLTDAEKTKIESIQEQYRPKIKQALDSVRGVLSEDQQKAREEALRSGKKLREVLGSLNLRGEQKEKLEAVGKEVRTLAHEELEKIGDALNDEQKEKLTELKDERPDRIRDRWAARVMNSSDLGLTDEQKNAIRQIRQEYRPRIHEAGNRLRADIREEVRMIRDVLKK
jgi:Spy/CpxP family protein refolding chaperone